MTSRAGGRGGIEGDAEGTAGGVPLDDGPTDAAFSHPEAHAGRSPPRAHGGARVELLDAGMLLFVEQGIEESTVEAVCTRAHRTRADFDRHFRSREDFLAGVMQHVVHAFLDAVVPATDPQPDLHRVAETFAGYLAGGVYPLSAGGATHLHAVLDGCARAPEVRAQYVALVDTARWRLERVVQASQGSGSIRGDAAPDHVATLLVAASLGLQIMLETRAAVDVAPLVATVLRLLERRPGG